MMSSRKQIPVVLMPERVLKEGEVGQLFGYEHPKSLTFNVVLCDAERARSEISQRCNRIGEIFATEQVLSQSESLVAWHTVEGFQCFYKGQKCRVEWYSFVQDVFSRNTGIVESGILLDSCAVISGCGSVGSLIALELTRAGVGRFLLIDNDVLAYHNLSRHQCGISDVGRFKTDALRDRILDINPNAQVCCREEMIESTPKDVFDEWCKVPGLIVGCADNREGDLYANKMSCLYGIPFVSIGLWERAFAGELFWSIPGKTPCYHCAFGGTDLSELSNRKSTSRRIYTHRSDIDNVTYEPGIATDIDFVTIIGAKIALDLLMENTRFGSGSRTVNSLSQFTLVCNSPDPKVGGSLTELFSDPLQITRSIEVERLDGCPHCALVSHA